MAAETDEKTQQGKIDVNAPAGAPNSLGAESDLNGRPSTDDSVVEAMDEVGPEVTVPGEDEDASDQA